MAPRPLAASEAAVHEAAVALRRRIHKEPETAFEEQATAALVEERMLERGFTVRTALGRTGVAALYETGVPGPVILLRADLDALPLAEKTGLPFASMNGKMHACGHDGHVAALDAAADLLLLDPPARGSVVFAFQPAEEGAGGATAMIADGVLENPKPDGVFGIPLWTGLPVGSVALPAGPMMASVDEFKVEVTGAGGHAASPHEARDVIVAAANVVQALQTIVSRRISPLHPAVVSVTTIHGGTAFNILPEAVTLGGTCRAFDHEAVTALPELVAETARAAAAVLGCTATTHYSRTNGPLVNARGPAERAARVARGVPGIAHVLTEYRTMGGEDFCEFLDKVPGAFAFVGAAKDPSKPGPPHHAPEFDFHEDALAVAARLHAAVTRDFLAS